MRIDDYSRNFIEIPEDYVRRLPPYPGELGRKLWENVSYLRSGLTAVGFDCLDSRSAVIPVMIGEELTTRRVGKRLNQLGIFVNPILYPAVARNRTRVRLSVTALHERADLDRAIEALETAGREQGLL